MPSIMINRIDHLEIICEWNQNTEPSIVGILDTGCLKTTDLDAK